MNFFRKRERDLDEEINAHLRMAAEEHGAEAARREFGNVGLVKETTRRVWGWSGIGTWAQDLRFGLRMLRLSPGLSVISILMLALGMALNITVFCWLRAITSRTLPGVREPQQLVEVLPSYGGNISFSDMDYPDFRELSQASGTFDGAFASMYTSALMRFGEHNEWLYGRLATANVFDVLGVKAERGRTFLADEDRVEGANPVLIISHELWQRRFGGDQNILGTSVELNRHPFRIVGVLPPGFSGLGGGLHTDFWAPISMHNQILNYGSFESHTFRWVGMTARLSAGVTVPNAQAGVEVISRRIEKAYPDSNKDLRYKVVALARSPNRDLASFVPVLDTLFGVAVGVLLIVVVNVANLLLVRGASRTPEMAVRLAIGARRSRLVRQLLTECALLGVCGAALGALLATRAVHLLWLFAPETNRHFDLDFRIGGGTLAFAVALALGITLVFGSAPAFFASRTDLNACLKSGGRGVQFSTGGERLRRLLVVAEVALAMLLLVGGGLTIQGFRRALRIDLGFDPTHLLCANLVLTPNGYSAEQGRVFDRQLRNRIAVLPGVKDAGLTTVIPLGLGNFFSTTVDVEGHAARPNEDRLVSFFMVSGGYFSTMRQPILAGRDFSDHDERLGFNVAIVNQAMVDRFWPGVSSVGRKFHMAAGVAPVDTFTVVGVVRTTKYRSLAEAPAPVVYLNYLQRPLASLFTNIVIRTDGDPQSIAPALKREIHALDPAVEPSGVATMEDYIRPAFEPARVAATLLGGLGATALLLASIGLYGVMAFVVGMRSREIGLRMALGAAPQQVFRLVLGQGLRLAAAGVLAGSLAALALTRLLASFLYGVDRTDLGTFAGAALLLTGVCLLACSIPAWRALRVEVNTALRDS